MPETNVLRSGRSELSAQDSASVFALSTSQVDALFRKARARRRIEQAYAQPRLFEDAKVGAGGTAVQGDMLLPANAPGKPTAANEPNEGENA
jgi:hypothetical protein